MLDDEKQERALDTNLKIDRKVEKTVKPASIIDITIDVKTILEDFISFKSGEAENLALEVEKSVKSASSLDWHKFPQKRILEKRLSANPSQGVPERSTVFTRLKN